MLIEPLSGLILGMDDHGAHSGYVGCLQRPTHGIHHKCRPQPFALPCLIDGQTGEDNDRHRMTGQPLCEALRCFVMRNLADD